MKKNLREGARVKSIKIKRLAEGSPTLFAETAIQGVSLGIEREPPNNYVLKPRSLAS